MTEQNMRFYPDCSSLHKVEEVDDKTKAFTCFGDNMEAFTCSNGCFANLKVRDLWYTGFVGKYQEAVACSIFNSGVLKSLISMGDVKAVFLGHDHLNDFCGNIDGIWFCYGGGFGYHGYGRAGWPRRGRVISAQLRKGKKTWMGVESIRTWKRLDDENLTKIDEQVLWIDGGGGEDLDH